MRRRYLLVLVILGVTSAMVVGVMRRTDPPAVNLARAQGAAYQVSVTRYFDGEGLVCQPFKIEISSGEDPAFKRLMLFAEQADDIVVAQTPSVFYVFYNKLSLTSFSASDLAREKSLLCDINLPLCAAEYTRLTAAGTKMLRLCGRVQP